MMIVKMNRYSVIVCLVALLCPLNHHLRAQAQKSEEDSNLGAGSAGQQETSGTTNISGQQDDVLVLMPTTSLSIAPNNNSQAPYESSYNLFKLDTDVLNNNNNNNNNNKENKEINSDEVELSGEDRDRDPEGMKNGRRSSRKINFLRGMWNKPKISPLYLVNGTVCRFVNSRPICTTLSTTGLLPANSSASTSGQFGGNGQVRLQNANQPFMGNQQFMGNQPMMDNSNQQQPYQNMNQQQQQQFLNNQNPPMSRQQPQRPPFAALIQDEMTPEVNIGTSESYSNASLDTTSSTALPKVQLAAAATNRPMLVLAPATIAPQRRPGALNLLGLRRPLRLVNGKSAL